ncbi:MAG: dienelactone hydrolase family protein [Steroidobacteraceae bacterium]
MSQTETLMARDGHEFGAYLARPEGRARGAIVVLQEIFGVNPYIRSVVDRYAAAGWLAIAPALFDRVARGIELGYTPADMTTARGTMMQVDTTKALLDIAAASAVVRHAGRLGVVGFCWGGRLAWLAGCEQPVAAAVAYYGTRIGQHLPQQVPRCPTLMHFGERDEHIPADEIARIRAACPQAEVHLYPAGHGFACDARASFDAPSAALAWQRTQDFLGRHLG